MVSILTFPVHHSHPSFYSKGLPILRRVNNKRPFRLLIGAFSRLLRGRNTAFECQVRGRFEAPDKPPLCGTRKYTLCRMGAVAPCAPFSRLRELRAKRDGCAPPARMAGLLRDLDDVADSGQAALVRLRGRNGAIEEGHRGVSSCSSPAPVVYAVA